MISKQSTEEIFRRIREDESNRYCFDCNNVDITFASVNLGIMLCSSCASSHMSFGINISHVKSIKENWSPRHLKLMTAGGNSQLKAFFSMYSLPLNSLDGFKYKTVACEYYREMLKMIADGSQMMMTTPSEEEGAMLMEEYRDATPIIQEKRPDRRRKSIEVCEDALRAVKETASLEKIKGMTVEAFGLVSQGFRWGAEIGKNFVQKMTTKEFVMEEAEKVYNKLQSINLQRMKEETLKMIKDLESTEEHKNIN